jgi:hypothetical protein
MPRVIPEGHISLREGIEAVAGVLQIGRPPSPDAERARAMGHPQKWDSATLEDATHVLWTQIDSGKVTVWAEHPGSGVLVRIDPGLLIFFGVRRYRLSDLSYLRPHHQLAKMLFQRFGASWRSAQLLLNQADVERIVRSQERIRKRQERHPGSRNRVGRPSKIEIAVPVIREVVERNEWNGAEPLKKLTKIVWGVPHKLPVSSTTITRALEQLAEDTGDHRFRRLRKAERSAWVRPG